MRLLLLTAAAGFAQVSVVTLLARDPWASPALPVAVLAAWSVNRSSDQAWLAVMPPAVVLGVVSAMPVGLFLLALLPVTLAGSVVARHGRDGAGESERWVGVLWRLLPTASVAAAGQLGYSATFALGSGRLHEWAAATPQTAISLLVTSAAALLCALLLRRRQPRPAGLFT